MQFYYFYHKLFVSIDLRLVFPQAENLPPWWGVFSSSWVVIWFYFLLRSISWRCVNITFDYVRRVNCVTLHYACHGTQHCITWQGISPRITIYNNVTLLYCTSNGWYFENYTQVWNFYWKGWGLSAKVGKHSEIWGKRGTALQAYTLNPCTKFPPNPTSRKVNTQHCWNSSMYA